MRLRLHDIFVLAGVGLLSFFAGLRFFEWQAYHNLTIPFLRRLYDPVLYVQGSHSHQHIVVTIESTIVFLTLFMALLLGYSYILSQKSH